MSEQYLGERLRAKDEEIEKLVERIIEKDFKIDALEEEIEKLKLKIKHLKTGNNLLLNETHPNLKAACNSWDTANRKLNIKAFVLDKKYYIKAIVDTAEISKTQYEDFLKSDKKWK